eukprot:gene9034-biopygen12179
MLSTVVYQEGCCFNAPPRRVLRHAEGTLHMCLCVGGGHDFAFASAEGGHNLQRTCLDRHQQKLLTLTAMPLHRQVGRQMPSQPHPSQFSLRSPATGLVRKYLELGWWVDGWMLKWTCSGSATE